MQLALLQDGTTNLLNYATKTIVNNHIKEYIRQ